MLTRAEKEKIVDSLKENIEKAQAVFLTNLIGVASNDANTIRKNVRDSKGSVVITKNTLFERAAKGTACEDMLKGLKGPHAVAFAFEDAAAIAKSLKDASELSEAVDVKGAILDGKELTKDEVKALANLPSRDQMLATLLATFNAPVSAFARVLNAIKEQKEEGAEAPAEA